MTALRLIVGLGNPGAEYEDTRHNVGFWFVDRLARELKTTLAPQGKFHGQVGRSGELWLLQPMTFMNRSGQAVAALARFYRIAPEEILVVHDELDLPPGVVRVKVGGGLAGNNGLRSITQHLHTQDYVRVRIGIGKPPSKERGADHVLSRLPKAERELLDVAVQLAADAVEVIVADGPEQAQQRFNGL